MPYREVVMAALKPLLMKRGLGQLLGTWLPTSHVFISVRVAVFQGGACHQAAVAGRGLLRKHRSATCLLPNQIARMSLQVPSSFPSPVPSRSSRWLSSSASPSPCVACSLSLPVSGESVAGLRPRPGNFLSRSRSMDSMWKRFKQFSEGLLS